MHTATIKVKYVNQPDKYPDLGSVKAIAIDSDYLKPDWEGYINVPKNMLQAFAEECTYKIGFTIFTGKTGKESYTAKEVRAVEMQAPASKVVNVGGTTYVRPNGHANGNGPEKDRFIFMCGIMNRAVQAGKVAINSGAIELAIREIYAGYDAAQSAPIEDTF